MLTQAGFEFAPSGYQSATLPVELWSPQGLEASFIQFKCTRYSRDNLTLIHERMCRVSILFHNHPQRFSWTFSWFWNRIETLHILSWISTKLLWEYLVHLNWIKLASNPCELDSWTGKGADQYPEGVSSNPSRVNVFQSTLAVLRLSWKVHVCLWGWFWKRIVETNLVLTCSHWKGDIHVLTFSL